MILVTRLPYCLASRSGEPGKGETYAMNVLRCLSVYSLLGNDGFWSLYHATVSIETTRKVLSKVRTKQYKTAL